MPLDAVAHLNPNWRCWHEPTPPNGHYHAHRDGYQPLSAANPEDLHTAILIAESHTVSQPIRPVTPGHGVT